MRQSKFLMLFFALTLLLFLPQGSEAVWSDPSCAPPGCNRPEPITVEGGTIQSGSLNLSSGVPLQAGDISVDNSGITVGAKLVPNSGLSGGEDTYLVCSWDDDIDEVVCTKETLGKNNYTVANDLLVGTNNLLLTTDGILNMTGGNNRIYISEGGSGAGGYGLYSQAHSVLSPILEVGYNSAIQGKSAITTTGTAYSYGVVGQASSGPRSFGLYGTAETDGYAIYGYNTGGASAAGYAGYFSGNFINSLVRYDNTGSWNGNSFVVKSSWKRTGESGNGEYDATADVIRIDYSNVDGVDDIFFDGNVYIGGDIRGTHQICLNDSGNKQECISSWSEVSGQGTGNAVFKTINAPSGTDPVADNAADSLDFLAGDNINISGNSSNDSITISVDREMSQIERINGKGGEQLVIDPDDDEGLLIYDKVYVDDLGTCSKVYTTTSGKLTCGSDQDNQTIDNVLNEGATTAKRITVGELCIGATCITEKQLQEILELIK